MDHPNQKRKHHSHPTALTGGMALWAGIILIQLLGKSPFRLDWPDWVAIHAMAITGTLDDRFSLQPRYKALVGLGVAMMLAVHVTQSMGAALDHVPFLGMVLPNSPVFLFPLLMLWFWAVPQAYNLIDGINGLSMGFAALLLGVLGWNLGLQSALLWGGLVAVLGLNFPKAHHFLGDCGALMLGTLFAILGVEAFALRDPNLLLWVFAYPIVDVSLVVGIRRWKGAPLSKADRSHLHHWMMEHTKGRSWRATPILLGLAALPMLRATAIPGHLALSSLGLLALIGLALKAFMDRITKPRKIKAHAQVRREIPSMAPGTVREPSGSHPKF
jgi:UDP-GlcNAc:undecaprenyl-phosphate GlcNAc-1-phosphate transferase